MRFINNNRSFITHEVKENTLNNDGVITRYNKIENLPLSYYAEEVSRK